jgi:hypothetical protein
MHLREPRRRLREALALAASLVGCGAIFGIDPPEREPDALATGGSPGAGGSVTGGADGGDAPGGGGGAGTGGLGRGGSSGASGARGGASAAGSGARDDGGAGAGPGGNAGASGAGGEDWPKEGERCSTPGRLACPGAQSRYTLICDGERWLQERCDEDEDEFCDRNTGACAAKKCDEDYASCIGQVLSVCGPDLVTLIQELCTWGCDQFNRVCLPAEDQLVVDRPPEISSSSAFWPDPIIPVCVRDAGSGEWDEIRAEVESTWGRYASVGFVGWNECGVSGAPGVELTLVENCAGELGGMPRHGYPGPGATLPVRICRSYYDAYGDPHDASEALLRFVARHEFGHVLGFGDEGYVDPGTDTMTQALRLGAAGSIPFNHTNVNGLQNAYGPKPSHSFLGSFGSCLIPAGQAFAGSVCDGSVGQRWQPDAGKLRHLATGTCLRSGSTPGSVELGDCSTPANDPRLLWEPRRVAWRGYGGWCVAIRPNPGPHDSPLSVEPCVPGKSEQTFWFEFLGADQVRVHPTSAPSVCVTRPGDWGFPLPGLATCDGVRDTFEAQSGQLSAERHCLTAMTSQVEFRACAESSTQVWTMSGPFENPSGSALSLSGGAGNLSLGSQTAVFPAAAPHVFDYHF